MCLWAAKPQHRDTHIADESRVDQQRPLCHHPLRRSRSGWSQRAKGCGAPLRRDTLLPDEALRAVLHTQDTLQCADMDLRSVIRKRHAHHCAHACTARLQDHNDKNVWCDAGEPEQWWR